MLQSVPDPPQSKKYEEATGQPVAMLPSGLNGSSQDGALNYAIHTPRHLLTDEALATRLAEQEYDCAATDAWPRNVSNAIHQKEQMLDKETPTKHRSEETYLATAKHLAEETSAEAHQTMKDGEDLLNEEAQLLRRLQEIQRMKQVSHPHKAVAEQAPPQSSNGNISPEMVCTHCRGAHESEECPEDTEKKQEERMRLGPVFSGTPTPPDDEDTPSVGGAPTVMQIQADATAALPESPTLEAQGTDANDWSSTTSQAAGEADADDSVSVTMMEYIVPLPVP